MNLPTELSQNLFQKWTHSHEDDRDKIQVYRSVDYDFPPARGRDSLAFQDHGVYIRYPIGPTDRNLEFAGTWSLKTSSMTLPIAIELQLPNQPVIQVVVIHCSRDRLELQFEES